MNETLIFLLLAGIALLFRWLTKIGGQSDESESASPDERSQRPTRSTETEEERIRRFLEALGAPPGSAPPPKAQPRPRRVVVPKAAPEPRRAKRSWVQPLPPIVTVPKAPPPLPPFKEIAQIPPAPPQLVVRVPTAITPVTAVPPRPPAPAVASRRGSLGALLRSPTRVRQAILLREVLGPPRGLQPFGAGF